MSAIQALKQMGQSIWYDNIARALLDSGELEALVRQGIVTGLTSNPTIFEKAVTGSADYDDLIRVHAERAARVSQIYLELVTRDIREAADLLGTVYEATGKQDGYVSVEVSPELAGDTEGTISEALQLYRHLSRPNLMIKVPGTEAGVPAIRRLTAEGVSVNVTLLFSSSQYRRAAEAYVAGLEDRVAANLPLDGVSSVASFFVSRVDTLVDRLLLARGVDVEAKLRGRAAIANVRMVYEEGKTWLSSDRWRALARRGARPQRLLWASTSTKDPRYPDTLYVDRLVAPNTVNTVPPKTLAAFMDHGRPVPLEETDVEEAAVHVQRLADEGIDLEAVGDQLQREGVAAFERSMASLLNEIERKRQALSRG